MIPATLESFDWLCPQCGFPNVLNIIEDDGPFISELCEECYSEFDIDWLRENAKITKENNDDTSTCTH